MRINRWSISKELRNKLTDEYNICEMQEKLGIKPNTKLYYLVESSEKFNTIIILFYTLKFGQPLRHLNYWVKRTGIQDLESLYNLLAKEMLKEEKLVMKKYSDSESSISQHLAYWLSSQLGKNFYSNDILEINDFLTDVDEFLELAFPKGKKEFKPKVNKFKLIQFSLVKFRWFCTTGQYKIGL